MRDEHPMSGIVDIRSLLDKHWELGLGQLIPELNSLTNSIPFLAIAIFFDPAPVGNQFFEILVC
jgi:hypothetical protein